MTPTDVIDDWLVNDPPDNANTGTSAAVLAPTNNTAQTLSEDILNDSLIAPSQPHFPNETDAEYAEYRAALSTLDFDNPREIEEFQRKFPFPNDDFFFGHKNYREYLDRISGY